MQLNHAGWKKLGTHTCTCMVWDTFYLSVMSKVDHTGVDKACRELCSRLESIFCLHEHAWVPSFIVITLVSVVSDILYR